MGGAPPPLNSLPGAVQVIADGAAPVAPAQGSVFGAGGSQQATRHARRIYVGGLPPSATEDGLSAFFSNALAAVGGTVAGPGSAVVNVYVNYEKKFAFVELRTVEEASNAMALDGIMYEGVTVRIRRPADYQAAAALPLGPSQPNPNLNLAAIGLDKKAPDAAAAAAAVIAAAMIPGPDGAPLPPPQVRLSWSSACVGRLFLKNRSGGLDACGGWPDADIWIPRTQLQSFSESTCDLPFHPPIIPPTFLLPRSP